MAESEVSLLDRLQTAFQQRTLVKLILSAPLKQNASHNAPRKQGRQNPQTSTTRYTVRPLQLKGGHQLQWTSRIGTQEQHENLTLADSARRLQDLFPAVFREVNLLTTTTDVQMRSRDGLSVHVTEREVQRLTPSVEHNRTKHYLIPEGKPCAFLEAIGVMTAEGRVRASMQHKFHQINRFLELVHDIVPHLPSEGLLTDPRATC